MIPASMGLRFQVPADLDAFHVVASWGTYETVETDKVTKAGRPVREYQAHPGRGDPHYRASLTSLRASDRHGRV
jgi:hypothetical protein